MVVLEKTFGGKKVFLSDSEKNELKTELTLLYNAGGRRVYVLNVHQETSKLFILGDVGPNPIGYIVGHSAILLRYILGIGKAEVGIQRDILQIIQQYCE